MEVTEPLEVRLDISDPPPVDEDEAALMADARESRPELRQAEALHRAAKLQSKSAFWTLLPSVGGNMYYSKSWDKFWDAVNPSEIDRNAQWGLGVDLNWRVFDGLAAYGEYKRSKAQTVAAAEAVRQEELQAALAVRQAQVAVKNAREGISAASESVAFAEENLRLQQALYENGGGTILEVNNAQAELTRAKNDLVNARIALQTAIAQKERALGR
jgi:outer membrane protein TolC